MTYYQFVQDVEKQVSEEAGRDITVCIHTAVKNNGRVRKGLMLTRPGVNISPAIYLEEYYEKYNKGAAVADIAGEILRLYDEVSFRQSWEKENILDYEKVKDRIVYHLINRAKNEELLQEVPYEPYLDMAIVFYVLIEISAYGTAAMMVRNENLAMWNVTEAEVYQRARRNTEHLLPYEFQTMRAVIAELTENGEDAGKDEMFVLSNRIRSFGAAAILYDERLKHIGEYLKGSFYVLPSSVHEVIIIPESKAPGKKELTEMVTEINTTHVGQEDILSDNAYYYDRELEKLLE